MRNRTYTLKNLEVGHLDVIRRALDFYGRVGLGQFREVLRVPNPRTFDVTAHQQAEVLLDVVRRLTMSDLTEGNSYHGIRSEKISDDFRVAYDVQQVIRHRLAWDRNPKGDFMVDFDEPYRTSESVPLVRISEEKPLGKKAAKPTKAHQPVKNNKSKRTTAKKVCP